MADIIGCTTTTTRYVYNMWNPAKAGATGTSNSDVYGVVNLGGSLTMRELQGDGIDQHLAYIDSSANWYLTDHLNSIRAVLNSSGAITATVAYDAYGNLTTAASPGLYDWTGREYDVETGLQYNRDRYYDSESGRWICQDPMGFDAGDSNLYRYVNNRPTIETDPSGRVYQFIDLYYQDDATVLNQLIGNPQTQAFVASKFAFVDADPTRKAAGLQLIITWIPRTRKQLDEMYDQGKLGWRKQATSTQSHTVTRTVVGIFLPALQLYNGLTPVNPPAPGKTTLDIAIFIDKQQKAGAGPKAANVDVDLVAGSKFSRYYTELRAESMNQDYNDNWKNGPQATTAADYIGYVICHEVGWHIVGQKGDEHPSKNNKAIDNESILAINGINFSITARTAILAGLAP